MNLDIQFFNQLIDKLHVDFKLVSVSNINLLHLTQTLWRMGPPLYHFSTASRFQHVSLRDHPALYYLSRWTKALGTIKSFVYIQFYLCQFHSNPKNAIFHSSKFKNLISTKQQYPKVYVHKINKLTQSLHCRMTIKHSKEERRSNLKLEVWPEIKELTKDEKGPKIKRRRPWKCGNR